MVIDETAWVAQAIAASPAPAPDRPTATLRVLLDGQVQAQRSGGVPYTVSRHWANLRYGFEQFNLQNAAIKIFR
jgi:hypothetical protein